MENASYAPMEEQSAGTSPASGGNSRQKNIKFFLFGLGGFIIFVLVAALGVSIYRVYARGAHDRFTVAVARALRLPALKVNGQTVAYSEYADDLKAIGILRQYDKANGGSMASLTDEQMSDQVLWRLANNILVEEAAKEMAVVADKKEIEDLENQIFTQINNGALPKTPEERATVAQKANEELMKRYGWTMDTYTKKVMYPYLLQTKLADKIQTDTAARQEVRARAEEVLEKIKGGEDFAALAKQYGEDGTAENGGDLGYFSRGAMVPQFETAAFSLKKGQLKPELVETQYGYHIMKVDDRRTVKEKDTKGKTVSKEEVKARHILFRFPSIEQYLDSHARAAKFNLYIKVHNPFTEPPPLQG